MLPEFREKKGGGVLTADLNHQDGSSINIERLSLHSSHSIEASSSALAGTLLMHRVRSSISSN